MVKAATPALVHARGDVIRYRFTVTNTDNVTLTRITGADPKLAAAGITARCPPPCHQAGRRPARRPGRTW